jgi:hypothetical protein
MRPVRRTIVRRLAILGRSGKYLFKPDRGVQWTVGHLVHSMNWTAPRGRAGASNLVFLRPSVLHWCSCFFETGAFPFTACHWITQDLGWLSLRH